MGKHRDRIFRSRQPAGGKGNSENERIPRRKRLTDKALAGGKEAKKRQLWGSGLYRERRETPKKRRSRESTHGPVGARGPRKRRKHEEVRLGGLAPNNNNVLNKKFA